MANRNTVGLDDDLDGVELAEELEAAFSFRFRPGEAEAIRNVGDIHDYLLRRFSGFECNDRCSTAMTFYRLRRAICDMTGMQARPETAISTLTTAPLKTWVAQIELASGLRLPILTTGAIGWAGLGLSAISILLLIAFALMHINGWIVVASFVIGGLMIWLDPRRIPADCRSVADLTRRISLSNYGTLVEHGALTDSKRLWDALIVLLSQRSTRRPDLINRESTILKSLTN